MRPNKMSGDSNQIKSTDYNETPRKLFMAMKTYFFFFSDFSIIRFGRIKFLKTLNSQSATPSQYNRQNGIPKIQFSFVKYNFAIG